MLRRKGTARRSPWHGFLWPIIAILLAGASPVVSLEHAGVLVEEVRHGMAGERVGLKPGDVLSAWRREPVSPGASGELVLPFDLTEVFLEQVPRGKVILEGRRESNPMTWTFTPGTSWAWLGVRASPVLPGDLQRGLARSLAELTTGNFTAGLVSLRSVAHQARARSSGALTAWLLAEGARNLAGMHRLTEADELYGEALAALDAEGESFVAAQLLRERGELARERFAWDQAEEYFTRALTADRRKGDSLSAAWSLIGLGFATSLGGTSRDSNLFFLEAMRIRQRLAPESGDLGATWFHWGTLASGERNKMLEIERYQRGAVLLEAIPEARPQLVEILSASALAHLREPEDAKSAKSLWLQAYAMAERDAPEEGLLIGITQGLGSIAAQQGDLLQAEALLGRSLELCRRFDSGGMLEAEALYELGLLEQKSGKEAAAARHLCQAVDNVERWRRSLQDREEARSRWGLLKPHYHRDCAESLRRIGRSEEAFLVIEKGRARAYLNRRAEHDVRLSIPTSERGPEWRRLNREYDSMQEALGRIAPREKERLRERAELEGKLLEIRRKKERIVEQSRPEPIQYPEPLSLDQARLHLEPGTAMLFYAVGGTNSLLFVLSPGKGETPGWTVLSLPIGAIDLQTMVDRFRKAMVERRASRQELLPQARALYELLVRPAEPHLVECERIVISPDGPLHILPFAALQRDGRYLVEWKPLHVVLSATVYADLLARRNREENRSLARLVAFGDAVYTRPGSRQRSPGRDSAGNNRRLTPVPPLPATRKEVEGLASLFPEANIYTGHGVTEEQVKEGLKNASLIHFAVHGLLDERQPLHSGLALSPSGRPGENGLLQAWEVMETLALDADLVTLSACNTGLGKETGGEGLIGLTRAFQYAGARSVLATLWSISDRSTAGFMIRLYRELRNGKPKDEALQRAQLSQIEASKPPFYWAAFQLYGDWS